MRNLVFTFLVLILIPFLAPSLIGANRALAMDVSANIGRIKTASGNVSVIRRGRAMPAKAGMPLSREDTLVTGSDGQLGVTFADNSRFALGPNTEIRVDTFSFNSTTHEGRFVSSVKKGRLSVISGRIAKAGLDAMQVRTPSQILGVRGTEFLVKVNP